MKAEVFILPVAVAAALTGLFFLLRGLTLRVLHGWAQRTDTQLDDLLLRSLRSPSLYWCVALGLYGGVQFSQLPERYAAYVNKAIYVLLLVSVTVVAAQLVSRLFHYWVAKVAMPLPTTGLTQALLKGVVLMVGGLMILHALGVSITPLLTALGVGGLAVALALQDTLANLFAGIHILLERSIRVGDFVRLEGGQEGYVVDIGWRTTKVRMLPNNIVVIPNSKLAQSVLTNYYLPEPRMSLLIPISVSYGSDPEHVERVLIDETLKAAQEVPGLLKEPAPFVRFIPGFGESSLDFTLICQVKEFVDQYLAQHELRKRIFKRFQAEGIEIPFPHRTVYLREEKDWQRKD
jgi:small-conductance mechanosensitive channel